MQHGRHQPVPGIGTQHPRLAELALGVWLALGGLLIFYWGLRLES